MASSPLSERYCDPCMKDDKQIKARTLCYECHTLLCESCSDYHHRLKITQDHHLIELVQFQKKSAPQNDLSTSKQTPTYINEDELASDFLETVTLTDHTVLYRGAQVAVESTSAITIPEKRTSSKQADHTQLKATRCMEFSVQRPEDKRNVNIHYVLCMSGNLVVVDDDNKVLKLFDHSGTYLSSTELKDYTWGITCVSESKFATCGQTINLWTIHVRRQGIFRRRQTIVREDVSYHVDHDAHGIHYNGTYYCVLHRRDDAITILDSHGRQIRKIIMKEACGKTFKFGWDIHMDGVTNNIYVPCRQENGVLSMTIEGLAMWFTTLSGSPRGIKEIKGTLCVIYYSYDCIQMVTKDGKCVKKLFVKKDLGRSPDYICYGQDNNLYVCFFSSDNISVFSVSW